MTSPLPPGESKIERVPEKLHVCSICTRPYIDSCCEAAKTSRTFSAEQEAFIRRMEEEAEGPE